MKPFYLLHKFVLMTSLGAPLACSAAVIRDSASYDPFTRISEDTEFVLYDDYICPPWDYSGEVFFSAEGYDLTFSSSNRSSFNFSYVPYYTMAIKAKNLTFKGLGKLQISDFRPQPGREGPYIQASGSVVFKNIAEKIEIADMSYASSGGSHRAGTGIYAKGSIEFTLNDAPIVIQNIALFGDNTRGAALASDSFVGFYNNGNGITIQNNGVRAHNGTSRGGAIDGTLVQFGSNFGTLLIRENGARDDGGAIYSGSGGIGLGNNGSIRVEDNQAGRHGGAFYSEGELMIAENRQEVTFAGNAAGGSGGAIFVYGQAAISENLGGVFFRNNMAGETGGAIHADYSPSLALLYNGTTEFTGNRAGLRGGAIYARGDVAIVGNRGKVSFIGNTAGETGGAIYTQGTLTLSADYADITFSDNKSGPSESGVNAVRAGTIDRMDAAQGRSITFVRNVVETVGGTSRELNINQSTMSTGTVAFYGDGIYPPNTGKFTSRINHHVNLHRGELRISDGAVVHVKSLDAAKGSLINLGNFGTLSADGRININSDLNLTHGFARADSIYLTGANVTVHGLGALSTAHGMKISSDTMFRSRYRGCLLMLECGGTLNMRTGFSMDLNTSLSLFGNVQLGGMITLLDEGIDYGSANWLTDCEFTLVDYASASGVSGSLRGIENSQWVAHGEWSLYDTGETYVAKWTYTGGRGRSMASNSFQAYGQVTPIPEPASAALGLAGLAGLMRRRRRV